MLVFGGIVRVMNTVISDNYNTDWTPGILISTQDSKTVEFSSSKFINNSVDIFGISSSNFLLIDNCSFENNNRSEFDIWDTYDLFLQRSRFYKQSLGIKGIVIYAQYVSNLRIFRCTFIPYLDASFSGGSMGTKVFRLDSVFDFGRYTFKGGNAILIEGSPYASGG